MKKPLLTIKIYDDINLPHEVILDKDTFHTINQNDLYEAIRQTIQVRLTLNHEEITKQLLNFKPTGETNV